jgi:hypothetical protein
MLRRFGRSGLVGSVARQEPLQTLLRTGDKEELLFGYTNVKIEYHCNSKKNTRHANEREIDRQLN